VAEAAARGGNGRSAAPLWARRRGEPHPMCRPLTGARPSRACRQGGLRRYWKGGGGPRGVSRREALVMRRSRNLHPDGSYEAARSRPPPRPSRPHPRRKHGSPRPQNGGRVEAAAPQPVSGGWVGGPAARASRRAARSVGVRGRRRGATRGSHDLWGRDPSQSAPATPADGADAR